MSRGYALTARVQIRHSRLLKRSSLLPTISPRRSPRDFELSESGCDAGREGVGVALDINTDRDLEATV